MIITPPKTGSSINDFPCCKAFFKFSEKSGNIITDDVSGSGIETGVTLAYGTANSVTFANGVVGTNLPLPSTIAVGAKSALMLVVVNQATAGNFVLGISGSARMAVGGAGMSVGDGTNTAAAAALSVSGAIVGGGTAFVSGTANEATKYEATMTTWATASATATPGDLTNIGNITHITTIGSVVGALSVYGMALFVFDNGLPSDVKAAIAWMTAEWARGNKAIYPGWKGLA